MSRIGVWKGIHVVYIWYNRFRKEHSALSVEDRLVWSRETSQKAIVVVWTRDDSKSDEGGGDGEERSRQI